MKIVFFSDAHLEGLEGKNLPLLLSFLDYIKEDTDLLVIVGDLFDFWYGYKNFVYYYQPLLNKLLELKNKGIRISYIEGNHDFFMGPFFTEVLNAKVYSGSLELFLNGEKILISHGDMINKKDYGYRILRGFLRSYMFSWLIKFFPSWLIWEIARLLSCSSRKYLGKAHPLDKIFEDFAWAQLKEGYDVVILAHTHNPVFKKVFIDGKEKLYANLGDWISHFTYLTYHHGEFSLLKYRAVRGEE